MAGKKKHKNLFFGITARALMLIAALLLFLSYISILFNPAKLWIAAVFCLLFFPLWLLNVFLLIFAVYRRSKAGFIPFFVLLPTIFLIGRYFQNNKEIENNGEGVSIISYNVGRFRASSEKLEPSVCADSISNLLKKENPDIICLQEVYMQSPKQLSQYFKKNFKGYYLDYFVYPGSKGCFGNVTLSRFPSKAKGKIDFEQSANLSLWCDYDIGGDKIRVYNCHFESYNISLAHLAQTINEDNYKKVFWDTETRMRKSIVRRPQQVNQVLRHIESSPLRSLVAGDFNDLPLSWTYNRLLKGRRDSFVDAGRGVGATYTLFRPFLRIDYILFPDIFQATGHKVIKKKFSDHYPVKASIK